MGSATASTVKKKSKIVTAPQLDLEMRKKINQLVRKYNRAGEAIELVNEKGDFDSVIKKLTEKFHVEYKALKDGK